jgi:hypothetical protein
LRKEKILEVLLFVVDNKYRKRGKSRSMRWNGHVARTEEGVACNSSVGEPEGKRQLGEQGVDGRKILKRALK